jgi:TetR/AcrR family transcriptional regulator, transcriptional repressor for nem operon
MSLKEKIIHESLKLFSLKGFSSTSLNDILDAAQTSKGGFYNHFKSKEDLFYAVLEEARKIWRARNLVDLDPNTAPVERVIRLLENFGSRYLKDSDNFPGGCVFITLSVELNDQRPKLSEELHKGFTGLKRMILEMLKAGKANGELKAEADPEGIAEVLFAGMLGASVIYGVDKSSVTVDRTIQALIDYINQLRI